MEFIVLTKIYLNLLDKKIDMPELIQNKKDWEKIGVFPIYEYWKDIGSLKDYALVNKEK